MAKKTILTLIAAAAVIAGCVTAYAGTWEQEGTDWKYRNDNGSYTANAWQWIDGKCYCFNKNGIMYKDCTTPDGFKVNGDGAWVDDNGNIQTQAPAAASSTQDLLVNLNRHIAPGDTQESIKAKYDILFQRAKAGDASAYLADYRNYPKTYDETRKFLTTFDWINAGELDRVKAIWKRVANGNCGNYYSGLYDTKTIYGDYEDKILVHKNGVCGDYCKTFTKLCGLMNVNAGTYEYLPAGAGALGSHEVVWVMIDGKRYMIDPTITGRQAHLTDGTEPWEQLMSYDKYIRWYYDGCSHPADTIAQEVAAFR